jgi:uncharacterized protein
MAHFRKDCISLLMTTNCNLSCTYCYLQNSNLDEQSIDVEFAKQGIRDFFALRDSRHIRFFGAGEPTLEFRKIVTITKFASELAGDDLVVEIQTNGVFSTKVARWLANNANIIWISCDGPPDIQNNLRPTKGGKKTSPIIERNIRIFQEEGKIAIVGIRATITSINIYRQIEMILYFESLGIKAIFSDPVFPPVENDHKNVKKDPNESDFNLEYAKEFLKARKFAEGKGIFYGSIFTVNFDEETEIFCRSCLPSPHLTTDGYVSCCDMSYLGDILPELVYGKYYAESGIIEYNQKKIQLIRMRKASNLANCKGCEILRHCAGACLGEGLNETGYLLGIKKDYCEAIKYLAKNLDIDIGKYLYLHP